MIKYGLKAATKDIDVLLSTREETEELIQALLKSGYHIIQTNRLGAEYQAMFATQIHGWCVAQKYHKLRD